MQNIDRQAIFDHALERISDSETKKRLIEANNKSLPPDGQKYDCWLAAMYIMKQSDSLNDRTKNISHLRNACSLLPELIAPGFLALAVKYLGDRPIHAGFVIEERLEEPIIWSKPGTSIAAVKTASEEKKGSGYIKYFASGLK